MTAASQWMDRVFLSFDSAVSRFAFALHTGRMGGFFDRFFPAITHLGDLGWAFIVLALALICFRKTRERGLTMICAMLIGLLVTNLLVKNLVGRPRPYYWEDSLFFQWWEELGRRVESEFSFPSGHTTASFAAMGALFLCGESKKRWFAFIPAILIAFSRIYIFVHYPSDVLGGVIAGLLSAGLARLLMARLQRRFSALALFLRAPQRGESARLS